MGQTSGAEVPTTIWPAVAAFPHLDLALREYLGHLHIVEQGAVALLVMLFNGGHKAELGGQLREALLVGGLREALVHIGPLVVFALGGVEQVLRRIADAVHLLEPHLGVLLLVVSRL